MEGGKPMGLEKENKSLEGRNPMGFGGMKTKGVGEGKQKGLDVGLFIYKRYVSCLVKSVSVCNQHHFLK